MRGEDFFFWRGRGFFFGEGGDLFGREGTLFFFGRRENFSLGGKRLRRPDIFKWLWIQDAIRDKVVRLGKVRGTDNEADMGIRVLDGPTHQRLLQKLPLKPKPSADGSWA